MIKLKDLLTEGSKFDDVFKDYGFDVEKKSGGLTYWAHYGSDISGHKNSYIRGELSGWTDGKKSAVGDDRGRQSFSNPKAMAKWFEKNFKMKKESVNEASKLTDADIKIGDAYHVKSHQGQMIEFVYKKTSYGWITVEYQFKPQYGDPGFMSVANTRADGVDGWGKNKKIKVTSQMKKHMVKTLQDAIKSKYKGSEETSVLLRNNLRLSDVLSWVKRL